MKEHLINFLKAYNLLDQFVESIRTTYGNLNLEEYAASVPPRFYIATIRWQTNIGYESEKDWRFYNKQWQNRVQQINTKS